MASYTSLGSEGLLRKAAQARRLASPCVLCGRKCLAKRFEGGQALGVCRTGKHAVVSSFGPHFGEEPPITGKRGSGTIFFSHCNLRCTFCQNYDIAHYGQGKTVTDQQLASIMLELQKMGCHNVNLVSPTHVVPQILSALAIAVGKGLSIPLVYNTGGYDSVETVRLLEGVVDVYMPDMKFGTVTGGEVCAGVPDYPQVCFAAVAEMHRQVGDLLLDDSKVARRGLLVRHLVLPQDLAATSQVLEFISTSIGKNTYVNLMSQYHPYYEAKTDPVLGRRITRAEYRAAHDAARKHGLTRLNLQ